MKKDFLNGDHSFKNWFKIMWGNHYIQIFVVAFGILIYELTQIGKLGDIISENFANGGIAGGIFTIIALCLPLTVSAVVAYKGFWQFWDDLKNGRSR
jgi:hypothetical protein